MSGWLLRKSFNTSKPNENAIMTRHEKWVHERNLDEIVNRLSQLLLSIMLMSIQQINEQYLPLEKRLQPKQTEDITF
jgi:hypothetical protein